jgi:molybdopterin synthase sulfur carrier subunit
MELEIQGFGIVKEFFGARSVRLTVDNDLTVAALKDFLEAQYNSLSTLNTYFIAVNNEYADETDVIHSGDEVAIIPPVSGG